MNGLELGAAAATASTRLFRERAAPSPRRRRRGRTRVRASHGVRATQEELEEKGQSHFEDYRFVSRTELDELGGEATILDMLNLFVAAYNERHTPPGYEPPEPPAEGEEKEEKEEGVEDNTPEEWLNAEGMHLVARVGTTDEAEAGVPLKNAELVNQARVGATRAPPRLASLARAGSPTPPRGRRWWTGGRSRRRASQRASRRSTPTSSRT